MAEFAIVALPLLFLLLAILQFALIYNAQVGLTNAIRDAARFGSGLAVTTTAAASSAASSTYARLTSAMSANVAPFSSSRLATATQVCFSGHDDGTGTTAAFVRVTAAYNHELVVPIVGAILDGIDGSTDGGYRITATTEMRVDDPTQATIAIPSPVCAP